MSQAARDRIVGGVAWTAIGKGFTQGGGFITGIVLARLLPPRDFGLIGMVTVLTGFVAIFSDLGFSQSLIQAERVSDDDSTTVFWSNLVLGSLICGALIVGAPVVADFYDQPPLRDLTIVLAASFVLGPLGSVANALLIRGLRFQALAVADTAAFVASTAVGLGAAFAGYGVWALVAQTLVKTGATSALVWWMARWAPNGSFRWSSVQKLSKFSLNLTGFTLVNYWARQGDDILIGKFLGASPLGLYSRAYQTMMLPVQEISGVLSRVMFPVLSTLQGDHAAFRRTYLTTIGLISLLTFPIMTLVGTAARPLIETLYGQSWEGAIHAMAVLAPAGAFQSIGTTVGWIYLATGRTDVMMKWGLFGSTCLIISIVIGVWLGSILTVAASYTVCVLVLAVPQMWVAGSLISLSPRRILGAAAWPAAFAVVAGAASLMVEFATEEMLSAPVRLGLQVLTTAVVYTGLTLLVRPRQYRELRGYLLERKQKRLAAKKASDPESP